MWPCPAKALLVLFSVYSGLGLIVLIVWLVVRTFKIAIFKIDKLLCNSSCPGVVGVYLKFWNLNIVYSSVCIQKYTKGRSSVFVCNPIVYEYFGINYILPWIQKILSSKLQRQYFIWRSKINKWMDNIVICQHLYWYCLQHIARNFNRSTHRQ